MSAPFQVKPLPEQGMFGRLFGRIHREAMLAEAETLLAEAPDWAGVPREAIAAIEAKYAATFKDATLSETMMLISRAATDMTAQQTVEGGAARLRQLASAFDLAGEAETVVLAKARTALAEAARHLIADDGLTDAERAAYAAAADSTGIGADEAAAILSMAVEWRMSQEIAAAIADDRLTADEEARIDTLGHALHARMEIDDTTRDRLARAKLRWQVDEGELPEANSPIALPGTERCLYAGYGQALEPRSRGKQSFTHSYGAGDIVLTTKRIIFNGGDKNIAVRLNTVIDFTVYDDGVEVRKATGKPLTFALGQKDEWFARIFERARREAG
ncbi:MAG: hypothetical protein QM698_07790 [Micropepsaceae bacterium]